MTSKLCRGRALLAALPLLWLHFGPMSAQSVSANTPASTSGQRQIESTVEEIFGASVEVSFLANRVLEIDLRGQKTAASVAEVITRLALDDVETDDVLLLSLRFRNGTLEGALELRDLTLPFALEFGDPEPDRFFSKVMTLEGMTFENMTFEKKVVFSKVSWSDRAFIDRSVFMQGLTIKDSTLEPSHDDDLNQIYINKTSIERDLHFLHLNIHGRLRLHDNEISPAFRIESSNIYDGTILRDNDFADLMIHGGRNYGITGINLNNTDRFEIKDSWFSKEVQISQNNIGDELVVEDITWDREFELAANTIGEEFYFKPKHVGYLAENGSVVSLVANKVGGVASITIPANDFDLRPLHVDLSSSSFQGRLNVSLSPAFDVKGVGQFEVLEEGYCYYETQANKGLTVDLSSATAKRFAWNLPFGDCGYRWLGSGFRYDEWLGDPRKHEIVSPYKPVDDLKRWQYQISDAQPSALIFMSDYLRAQGRFTASRSALFDAKRMDYEPTSGCDTMRPWQMAFWAELWAPDCFRQKMLYAFMWTSGFGVKPEYGLAMLAGTWVLGVLFYGPYVWFMRWREDDRPIIVIPRWLDALLRPADGPLALAAAPPLFPAGSGTTLLGSVPGKDTPGICPPRGFQQYHDGEPKDFKLWVFSLDATIPVVNLHAYDAFFPSVFLVRVLSFIQHIFGWWIVTSLLASLALL